MSPSLRRALAAAAVVFGAACEIPHNSPVMMPGQDCGSCHDGRQASRWSVSGTVYADPFAPESAGVEGAEVLVTDADGRALTLRSNSAGNFYTAEELRAPLKVQVQRGTRRMAMIDHAWSGSCNSCHRDPPAEGAPGRVFVP